MFGCRAGVEVRRSGPLPGWVADRDGACGDAGVGRVVVGAGVRPLAELSGPWLGRDVPNRAGAREPRPRLVDQAAWRGSCGRGDRPCGHGVRQQPPVAGVSGEGRSQERAARAAGVAADLRHQDGQGRAGLVGRAGRKPRVELLGGLHPGPRRLQAGTHRRNHEPDRGGVCAVRARHRQARRRRCADRAADGPSRGAVGELEGQPRQPGRNGSGVRWTRQHAVRAARQGVPRGRLWRRAVLAARGRAGQGRPVRPRRGRGAPEDLRRSRRRARDSRQRPFADDRQGRPSAPAAPRRRHRQARVHRQPDLLRQQGDPRDADLGRRPVGASHQPLPSH